LDNQLILLTKISSHDAIRPTLPSQLALAYISGALQIQTNSSKEPLLLQLLLGEA
jgi:hypothetical protein